MLLLFFLLASVIPKSAWPREALALFSRWGSFKQLHP